MHGLGCVGSAAQDEAPLEGRSRGRSLCSTMSPRRNGAKGTMFLRVGPSPPPRLTEPQGIEPAFVRPSRVDKRLVCAMQRLSRQTVSRLLRLVNARLLRLSGARLICKSRRELLSFTPAHEPWSAMGRAAHHFSTACVRHGAALLPRAQASKPHRSTTPTTAITMAAVLVDESTPVASGRMPAAR